MAKRKNNNREKIVNEDAVSLNSFHAYESSDDDETKIVEGKPVVADFHMYDSKKKKKRKWIITFFFNILFQYMDQTAAPLFLLHTITLKGGTNYSSLKYSKAE